MAAAGRLPARVMQAFSIAVVAATGALFALPLEKDTTEFASYAGTFLAGLLIVLALAWATRVSVGLSRLPWIAMLAVYALGMIVYTVDRPESGAAGREVSAAMFGGPFATAAQIGVVVLLARHVLIGHPAGRVALDAAWLGSASLLISWDFVGAPVTDNADLTVFEKGALVSQLVAFVLLLGLIAAVLPAVDRGGRRVFLFLSSPAVLLALSLTVQARVVSTGSPEHGTLADFLFPLAFGVGAVAVLEWRAARLIRPRRQAPGSDQLIITVLPLVVWVIQLVVQQLDWIEHTHFAGYAVGVIAVIRLTVLIGENKSLARDLHSRAMHDHLTGLPNRPALLELIEGSKQGPLSLLLMDLDRFKTINDVLGHRAGDELLVDAARRMERVAGPLWTVTRLSGDEFVITGEHTCDAAVIDKLGRSIIEELTRPFEVGNREVWVSATIGVATTADGLKPTELLEAADAALRRAKRTARGQVLAVRSDFRDEAALRRETELALHDGIDRDELFCVYQPKVGLISGKLLGFEALVRWNRPGHGVLAPAAFIEVAEASGLITRIDEWVLKEALDQLGRWNAVEPSRRLSLSTNMSAWQLSRTDVHEVVARTIAANGRVDPSQLTVELTETSLVESPEVVARRLGRLREVGVGVSIDDFGAGFTAIAYLRDFPVNEVKIDRALVEPLDGGPDDQRSLAAAVIALGGAMDLQVVAEGVETPAQALSLSLLGCRRAQGFLFSEPLAWQDADRLVANRAFRFTTAAAGRPWSTMRDG